MLFVFIWKNLNQFPRKSQWERAQVRIKLSIQLDCIELDGIDDNAGDDNAGDEYVLEST